MLNACTIIACNYLPFARVLADSFFAHHPLGSFTVLLIDDEQRRFAGGDSRIDWKRLGDIGLDPTEVQRLAGIYDVTELATAVKPMLLRRLLDEGRQEVVYLDPDIRIFDSLEEVATLARQHGIVLTPHTMGPFPEDERDIDGLFVLASGVYNLGFIGVGASSREFLDWWWQKTRRGALIDVTRMMFTDQRWVDFVPSFFDHYILKDPGYNVAYWNLHSREVINDGQRYLVNGVPLRFFHFSGYDPAKPWLLSKHQGKSPRVLLSERPIVAELCRAYRASLERAMTDAQGMPPYGWSRLPSGVPISTRMRRLYWDGLVRSEHGKGPEPASPFDATNPNGFLDWLNSPAELGPRRVSRFLYSIYKDREDLQLHFPDIYGKDATSFAKWIWSDGTTQETIPVELLPPLQGPAPPADRVPSPALGQGLNLAGFFRAELGIGEAARQLTAAVETAEIPFSTMNYDATLNRQSHPFAERPAEGMAYDINVICLNAETTPRFARDAGPEFFAGRHTAGYWFWEVEQFPASMHPAFEFVNEVWTATDFIGSSVRAVGARPVFTVPLPVPVPGYSSGFTRARLGLPDRFTFLLIFDFLSILERKNPHGLITAFTNAFTPEEGPILVVKSINGHLRLGELERLRGAVGDRQDVRIVDSYYTEEEKNALLGLCDCYVSLHRSEGLGLTMAEAMALAKPVIATGYSGNLHFMTEENSYLVDYVRTSIPPGCDPYPTSASWADPDLDQAAGLMREIYERPTDAVRRARLGQRDVMERHNRETSARAITQRVDAIRQERRNRVAGPVKESPSGTATAMTPAGSPEVGLEQLEASLPPLGELATLRLSSGGRSLAGLRLFAQRALFRILRPLWFQQHQFHAQLVATLGLTASALRAEQRAREAVDTRVRELTRKLLATRREAIRLEQSIATAEAARKQAEALSAELEAALTAGLAPPAQSLAVPNMAESSRFLLKDAQGREFLGYRSNNGASSKGFSVSLQDIFRGPEDLTRERQRAYLALLRSRSRVVDLGCGRGEMLDLLQEAGVPATGVDADADIVQYCRAKGHIVEEVHFLEFLRRQAPNSIPAVFSARVMESLTLAELEEFLNLCRSRLQPGGLLVAEIVNPYAAEALEAFRGDLTHQRTVFPEVALALCQMAGFEEAHVMFPLGQGPLERDRESQGEYAVVARGTIEKEN